MTILAVAFFNPKRLEALVEVQKIIRKSILQNWTPVFEVNEKSRIKLTAYCSSPRNATLALI